MVEARIKFIRGTQVRLAGDGPPMIVDVASAKLAICHWFVDGCRVEGVFDVRSLQHDSKAQQFDLWSLSEGATALSRGTSTNTPDC